MDNNNNFLLLIIAAIVIYYFLKDSFDCSNNVEGFSRRSRRSSRSRMSSTECIAEDPIDGGTAYTSCADRKNRIREHNCKTAQVIDDEGPYESCADKKQTEQDWCESNDINNFKKCLHTIRNELKCKDEEVTDGGDAYTSCADMKNRQREHICKTTEVIDDEGPYESCDDMRQTEQEWCESNDIDPKKCQNIIRNELKCRNEIPLDRGPKYTSCAERNARVDAANVECREEVPIDAVVMDSNDTNYGYQSCEDRNARIRNFRDCIVEKAPTCLYESRVN